jgi:hypothetical protein
MAFDKVQFIFHKAASLPGSLATVFEPVTLDMIRVGAVNDTGYVEYKGSFWYIDRFGAQKKTLDLVADGPKGRAEAKFFEWMRSRHCNPIF